ncbi:hypothetical protein XELAEV_18001666mg [Xenopus laevis]|uniref:Uncharacterized protein n=1 Tax=Xenopus laevis TaxID=8355 RepID=A0A974GYH2_XENLA|nr:hypothetical protein XELAEV_18001666mg [Xenopus laevis]
MFHSQYFISGTKKEVPVFVPVESKWGVCCETGEYNEVWETVGGSRTPICAMGGAKMRRCNSGERMKKNLILKNKHH